MEKLLFQGFRRSSLALSVAAVSAAFTLSPGLALGQQQGGQAEELEEITVTGSRIRATSGFTQPTPVTAMTPDELTSFEPGGTVAEQLDALPQFFGNSTAQRGGGALFGSGGGSYLDMRSLGNQRTLVLLDGSRVVPSDKRGSVNVDVFPTALMQTVDVVTGGASAAYGADALGGVTNFVLDREFEGLKVSAGTGVTEWGDGERWNFSIAGGRQFGERLNVIASVEARHINQITRDPTELDPDWFQRWGYVTCPEYQASGTGPRQCTYPWVASSQHSPYGLIRNTGTELDYNRFTPDGENIVPFVLGDVATIGGAGSTRSMAGGREAQIAHRAFGGGPGGQEVVGRSGFLGVQYQLTDTFTTFAQGLVGRSESNASNVRSGYSLQDLWYASVPIDNAYLPDNVRQIMLENDLEEFELHKLGGFLDTPEIGSDERDENSFTTTSWSVGFDWMMPNGWDMRASWQRGESHKVSEVKNKIRVDRMFLAMDAVRDPDTGAIVCRVQLFDPTPAELYNSVAVQDKVSSRSSITARGEGRQLASPIGLDNTVRDCVPYNVMGNGNISSEAIEYMGTQKVGEADVEQDFGEILVTGEVYEGWGYGPLSMAAGLTWREQSFAEGAQPVAVDDLGPPLNDPSLGIRGIPPGYTGGSPNLHQFSTVPLISGQYDVWEWFGELNVPIWESTSAAQSLDGSLAFRRSDYSTTGEVDSWKIGLDFQVFNDLRLRATKSRDVREANFSERFDAQGGGGAIDDPRFGGEQFQITSVTGGNPNLRPEVADTTVAGFVYQPSWLEGLQVSADWYEVDIRDAIDNLSLQRIVDECEAGVQDLCQQITRDPDTGVIGRIFAVNLNVAQAYVEGVDFEAVYRTEPNFFGDEFESFNFRALAGYIMERSNTPFQGDPFDVAGSLGNPELTSVMTGTYNVGPFSVMLQGRYYADVLRSSRWVEGVDVDDNTIPSSTWFNGRLGYNGETNTGATWNVALNVQNIFDRNPPTIPSFSSRGGAQSTSSVYDTLGRRYQLSVNYNF